MPETIKDVNSNKSIETQNSPEANISGIMLFIAMGTIAVGVFANDGYNEKSINYVNEAVDKTSLAINSIIFPSTSTNEELSPQQDLEIEDSLLTPVDMPNESSLEASIIDSSNNKSAFAEQSSAASSSNSISVSVSVLPLIKCNEEQTECTTNEYCIVGIKPDGKYESAPCEIEVTKDEAGNVTITESVNNVHFTEK